MANAIYPEFKEAALNAMLGSATVKMVLIDLADYSYSAAHDFLADIPSGARVGISSALTSKDFSAGVFSSSDASFIAVSGDQYEAIAWFIDTGDEATSRVVAFQDTGVDGLPATPDGGNVVVECPTEGWFTL